MATVDRMVHIPVSIMVGRSRAMDAAAAGVQARIIAEATRHRLTGAFIRSIKIEKVPGRQGNGRLVTDRLIYSDDPAALSIEFGHRQGKKNKRFIPGQYIFTRAYGRPDATGSA